MGIAPFLLKNNVIMKHRFNLIAVLSLLFIAQSVNAERISILRRTGSITHNWTYQPSGDVVTRDGMKNKVYPLTLQPSETYLISEPIDLSGYENIEMRVTYYVATTGTHPLKMELIGVDGEVLFSDVESKPSLNTSTMSIGHSVSVAETELSTVRIKLSLSNSYSDAEKINIEEFEIYGDVLNGVESVTNDCQAKVSVAQCVISIEPSDTIECKLFSILGTCVYSEKINNPTEIEVPAGLYVLRLGDFTQKILVH